MYRLTVVSGPGRGTSFKLKEGENVVGRQLGDAVVLPSSRVSKRHCVLVASNGEVIVQDQGSANGTFVNGVLTRTKKIQPGDRIGVGEFVLELSGSGSARNGDAAIELQPMNNVIPFPSGEQGLSFPDAAAGPVPVVGEESGSPFQNAAPKDLKGKALWAFENYVMPIFYGLNLKSEWRMICVVVFAGFLVLNLVISVQPLLNANGDMIMLESSRRAGYMAREIAERNAPALAAGAETKTEIGLPEKAEGVTVAVLTDLDLRIIAPANRMNQYLAGGEEGRFASAVASEFRKGRETGVHRLFGDFVMAIQPVKVFDPKTGRNVVVGMSIVGVDASTSVMGLGEVGIVYSQTFIITAVLGALMLLVLYRLTLKPFQILNEDMDKALKGDLPSVTHEFKLEELNPLWDLINSSLQRIPRASQGGSDDLDGDGSDNGKPEQFLAPVKMLSEMMKVGVALCGADRKIAFINDVLEDLSGIRADSATGQEFSAVARDQSLGGMVSDLFDRATPGGESVSEEYEFSGIPCRVIAAAFGTPGEMSAKSYVLAVMKKVD